MIKVDNFLGFFKLETGGAVIGWLCLIIHSFGILFSALCFIVLSIFDCNDIERFKKDNHFEIRPDFQQYCETGRSVALVLLLVFVLILSGLIYIDRLCIKGSRNRVHTQIKPMMIFMAIATALAFINILTFSAHGIVVGLVYGVIDGYAFVVLYSLFSLLRDESERGFIPQYHAKA